MQAAVIEEPGKLTLMDVPDPSPGPYECLCRMTYCATCTSTDKKLLHDDTPWENSYPSVLGHESVGEVVEVGEKVRSFAEGDIVLRPAGILVNEERGGYGSLWGGLAEYGVVVDAAAARADGKEPNFYSAFQKPLPRSWKSRPESSMLITFKETLSWMQEFGLLAGKRVCVVGTGAVGLFMLRAARMQQADTVCALGRRDSTLALAAEVGADRVVDVREEDQDEAMNRAAPEGFDVLIDAAGVLSHIEDYIPHVRRPGGVVAIYGMDVTDRAEFPGFGGNFTMSFHTPREDDDAVHRLCLALEQNGFFDLERYYSRVMPFSEVEEGYRLLEEKEEFKIVFEF